MPEEPIKVNIFKLRSGNTSLLKDEDFKTLAGKTDGYSGDAL